MGRQIWCRMGRKLCLRHKGKLRAGVALPKGLPRAIRATCVKSGKESKTPAESATLVPPDCMSMSSLGP